MLNYNFGTLLVKKDLEQLAKIIIGVLMLFFMFMISLIENHLRE